jgi:hypothetical protein
VKLNKHAARNRCHGQCAMKTPPPRHTELDTQHDSTPVAPRISSVRYSDSAAPVTVPTLNSLLDLELEDAVIQNASGLVDTIFPNQSLPFAVDKALLHHLPTFYSNHHWQNLPALNELGFATWMNDIGSICYVSSYIPH